MSSLADDLELALELAELAAEVALPLFARGVDQRRKADGSIVTEGDLAVEARLLERLARARPGDAWLSEESGARGQSRRRWILDPIDGTHYFARGDRSWGTHVALESDGEIVLGVITRPVTSDWFWAVHGQGAHAGRLGSRAATQALSVSERSNADGARIMLWDRGDSPLGPRLQRAGQWVEPTLDGMLDVARGQVDALIDELGEPWDLAPAVVIVEEAGGRFVDRDGAHRVDRLGGRFSNGRIDGVVAWP